MTRGRHISLVHFTESISAPDSPRTMAVPQVGTHQVQTSDDTGSLIAGEPCELNAYCWQPDPNDMAFGIFEIRQGETSIEFEVVDRAGPHIGDLNFRLQIPDAAVFRCLDTACVEGLFRNPEAPTYSFEFDLTGDTPVFRIEGEDILNSEPNSASVPRM